MHLWTALLLGIVGSLHCAGMCGPIAFALPNAGRTALTFYLGRIGYNLGRVTAYGFLGLVFGLIGQTFALAGFQRWASLLAGATLLFAVLPFSRVGFGWPAARAVGLVKAAFAAVLQRRSGAALYFLGFVNGFLPCGLVYAACAGAVAVGGVLDGAIYMLVFGAGTVPMLLAISIVPRSFALSARWRLGKLVPICLGVLGMLLILRGMSLGIPYLSPVLTNCH